VKSEAVIVSVNYSDFLAHTLPLNKYFFNRIVVVTDLDDDRTRQICAYHRVRCVQTDDFYKNGEKFNKGAAINYGLSFLDMDGWVAHMDADIVLPPRTRLLLNRLDLDPAGVYGVDRLMCPSYEDWQRFVVNPELQHTDEIFVSANAFPLGARVAKLDKDGYVPIGFFQLWNPAASGVRTYPTTHGTAGRTDMLFSMQWPRTKRHLLPEIVAIHLESEEGACGANWRGRTTKHFGPVCDLPRPPFAGCYEG
jgi:glycosyltransferase involved in cell wall biosynthesis